MKRYRRTRKSRRYVKKRRYAYKGRRKGRRLTLRNKGLTPFPSRYITSLKYSDTFSVGTTSGVSLYQFRLNSIFDPNLTGTGHQPYGHDELADLYNRYRVVSVSYVVTCAPNVAGSTRLLCVIPSNDAMSIVPEVETIMERPMARFRTIIGGQLPCKLRGKVYVPKLVGRTRAQYMSDDRYQAEFGTNPQEVAVLNIYVQDISESIASATNFMNVTLIYKVELFDYKQLLTS